MTTYTHKENKTVKNYGEVLREFNHLRRTDDEFARDYRSTEVNRYIMDNYLTTPLEIETNSEEELSAIISNEPESMDDFIKRRSGIKVASRFGLGHSTAFDIPCISSQIEKSEEYKILLDSPNTVGDHPSTSELKKAMIDYSNLLQNIAQNFDGWVERLDNILLGLETHSPSINQIPIDDLAKVIAEMKYNK